MRGDFIGVIMHLVKTRVSTEVNLAEEEVKRLNESTRQISQLADNLTNRAEIIRRGDTKVRRNN